MAPLQERRLLIERDSSETFRYIPREKVQDALDHLGIKASFIEAMYIRDNGLSAIAVARAGEEAAVDHFVGNPIIRGVDQLRTVYETDLLLRFFTGKLDLQKPSYLASIENVAFDGMIIPPHTFNVVVNVEEENDTVRKISGAIYSGGTFIMGAEMQMNTDIVESVFGGDILLSTEGDQFSKQEVDAALEALHYGPSRRLLGDMVVEKDGKKATALLESNEEIPLFEHIEQVIHVMLVAVQKKGKIRSGTTPILTGISSVSILRLVIPPTNLTLMAREVQRKGQNFDVEGTIRCGDTEVMTIAFSGRGIRDEIVGDLVSDRRDAQKNEPPLFPLQD